MALPLLEEISVRIGLNVADMMHSYRNKDITDFLRHGTRLSDNDVSGRKQKYFYQIENRETSFYSGEHASLMKEEQLSPIPSDDFVVGRVACPGIVNGMVRIVANEDIESVTQNLKDFETGSILVTTMTHPNMILLVERALGIITDEGGITSHAAILALEMNKPCLVGTKFATKIFKNGDIVKLDATNGRASKI